MNIFVSFLSERLVFAFFSVILLILNMLVESGKQFSCILRNRGLFWETTTGGDVSTGLFPKGSFSPFWFITIKNMHSSDY